MNERYYNPSRTIDNYIRKELQNLGNGDRSIGASETNQKGKEGARAKAKFDALNHIFQSFADIICFFEFIHEHPHLQALYQEDLRDLFGFHPEPYTRPHHFKNRGGPFHRFLHAILYQEMHLVEGEGRDEPDPLHIWLMAVAVDYGIGALIRALELDDQKIMHLYYNAVLIKTRSLVKGVNLRLKDEWKQRTTKKDDESIEAKAKIIADESHLERNSEWARRRAEEDYYRKNIPKARRTLGFHSVAVGG